MSRIPEAETVLHNWVNTPPPIQPPPGTMLSQPEIHQINTMLVDSIQTRAKNPGVRVYTFNLLARDGFDNQAYRDLFVDACVYASALKAGGVQGYVERAVMDCIKVETARVMDARPDLSVYMTPEHMQQLMEYRQLAGGISNLIKQTQMQSSGMMGGMNGMMGGMNGMMPQQGNMMGLGMGMGMGGPVGGYNNHYSGSSNMSSLAGSVGIPQSQSSGGRMTSFSNAQPTQESNPAPTSRTTFTNMLDTTNNTPVENQPLVDALSNARMHPRDDLIGEPVIWFNSKLPPVLTKGKFLVINDGKYGVTTMLEYEQIEPNTKMIDLHRDITGFSHGVEYGVNLRDLMETQTVSEETPREKINLNAVVRHTDDVRNYSLESILVDAKVINYRKTGVKTNAFEITGRLATPIEPGGPSSGEPVVELLEQQTLTRFVDMLNNMKSKLSISAWMILHDRLTAVYNRRLATAKTGIEVDSLSEDYEASCDILGSKLSVPALDRFRDNTLAAMRNCINVYALQHEENDEDSVEWGVVESVSITYLPLMSETLDLKLVDKYGFLNESIHPEIYSIMKGVIDRTNTKGNVVSRRFMVTADNVYIEMHMNDFDPNSVIISKYN